jgi:hypothetical protein
MLGSGVQLLELGHVKVEVFVVESSFHLLVDKVFEQFEVNEVASFGVNLARHLHLQLIVVAVEVGVAARAEHGLVALLWPSGVVEAVCGVEVGFSEHGDSHGLGIFCQI